MNNRKHHPTDRAERLKIKRDKFEQKQTEKRAGNIRKRLKQVLQDRETKDAIKEVFTNSKA